MRILVTYAVQGEFTELKFPGLIGEEEVQVGYLRTGIGKVKSAFYLTEAINRAQPDLVVNVGTAGTVRHQVGDIFVCRHFVDRDMQRLKGFDMECEIDSAELLAQKGYCLHWQREGVCNVGCKRRCGGYGGLCPGMGVPYQEHAVHRREVCDGHYRAEFGETLGR